MAAPLVIINAVGLTRRLLASAPRLRELAQRGWVVPFHEVLPAVTCSAQATLLTGTLPHQHGIVANGWLFRDTNEVRFWQQSNRLVEREPFYATARRRAAQRKQPFKSAKFFWWFNQGAEVDLSVTPKPHYALDGRKAFDITSSPPSLGDQLKKQLGDFPFQAFWGPMAGLRSTEWIAAAAALTLLNERPDLLLVYLPHLDYDPQRFGPAKCDMPKSVSELDKAAEPLLDAARTIGARVWVVSEYGHCDVSLPVFLNRTLRTAGLLSVRKGPFGEQLDLYASRAFVVCDHQIAHVYVRDSADHSKVAETLGQVTGVDRVLVGEQRADLALDHPRSGEIIVLSRSAAWFAYPFWMQDDEAPDYAPCVAIHHKPGFDPCELFFDPKMHFPKLRIAGKMLQKMLGFRMAMNLIPLDANLIGGSHGLAAAHDDDRPVWLGDGPPAGSGPVPMTAFREHVLTALGLPE